MTILRSREIPSTQSKIRHKQIDIEPSTPARTQEAIVHRSLVDGPTNTSRRRSLRLQSLNGFSEKKEVSVSVRGKKISSVGEKVLSSRSGKRVAMRDVDYGDSNFDFENRSNISENGNKESLKFEAQVSGDGFKERKSESGSKRKRNVGDLVEDSAVVNEGVEVDSQARVVAYEEKGKEVMEDMNTSGVLDDSLLENCVEVVAVENETNEKLSSSMGGRKYTWEEKGKGIKVENVSSPINNEIAAVGLEEMEIEMSVDNKQPADALVAELSASAFAEQTQNHNSNEVGNASRIGQFREIAKRNASKFAHFDGKIEEEEDLSDKEVDQEVGDWPGPFSTAMKIIKDREDNAFLDIGTHVSNEKLSSTIVWAPKRDFSFFPPRAPSLQELSLRVLVKNADAITSLDYIPDALRVKICELLCDSRIIDVHFLDLLVRGSPTEIRVPDCSWLTEEQFSECFKNCNTSSLTVLQLDQCGQCMPDYVLQCTLARSLNNLPMLSSLSLCGAYRLSDVGLRALVSIAPAIRSVNLSQCSLLTSSSIDMLSDLLGSVLRELYINECQNIDLELILPALKKFEKLEVLSLADLSSVRGRLLSEFLTARGQTLTHLILTNSVKLTDSCVKAISENCPNLNVLDLANVCKLTDSALGYLANGCLALEKLIFCRNSFSDEAVAAFVETAGGSLKELSLNNVKKVGHNTALALAKHSKKLQILDVSWCRDMLDDSLGYIVDNCLSLNVLKVFGCTQITDVLVRGHSNPNVKILGLKLCVFLRRGDC